MNYNWGTRLENNNRLTEAFAAYEAALKCIPTDHGALLNSGFILEKQGSSDVSDGNPRKKICISSFFACSKLFANLKNDFQSGHDFRSLIHGHVLPTYTPAI